MGEHDKPGELTRRSAMGLAARIGLAGMFLTGCGVAASSSATPPIVAPRTRSGVLFDAEFTRLGTLEAYPEQVNVGPSPVTGEPRARIIDDPVHGPSRRVAMLVSDWTSDHHNPNPRVALETHNFVRAARSSYTEDIYYAGFAVYLPDRFQELSGQSWLTFASGAYGAPYGGSGPLSLGLIAPESPGKDHSLILGARYDLLRDVNIPRAQWVDLVLGFRLAYAAEGGWVSMWINRGAGWNRVPVNGQSRASYDALAPGVNDGWYRRTSDVPNSSSICAYGDQPNAIVHGWHRVGRFFEDVMPNSYPGSNLPAHILTDD